MISPAICFVCSSWQYLREPGLVRLIGISNLAISLQVGYFPTSSSLPLPPFFFFFLMMLHLSCRWCRAHCGGWTAGLDRSFLDKRSRFTPALLGTINIMYRYPCHRFSFGDPKSGWAGEGCVRRGWRKASWFIVRNVREQKRRCYINVLTYLLKTAFCSFQCLRILLPEAGKQRERKRERKKLSAMLPYYLFTLFMYWRFVQIIIHVWASVENMEMDCFCRLISCWSLLPGESWQWMQAWEFAAGVWTDWSISSILADLV